MSTKHFTAIGLCIITSFIVQGQKIGFNIATPAHPVQIQQPTGMNLLTNEPVLYVTYTGQNEQDVIGIRSKAKPANYYGIGGHFEGGWIGLNARVQGEGSQTLVDYYAVNAVSYGTGLGKFYGIYSAATGSGTNYGVYANAYGGTTNWAGYFDHGNVHIKNTMIFCF